MEVCMFYVYILDGTKGQRRQFYVGRTRDLKRRYRQHEVGDVWTTRRMASVRLIFYEAFLSKEDATRRERYLKTQKGRSTLKLMLRETLKV